MAISPGNCTESRYSQAGEDVPSDPLSITDTLETMNRVFRKDSTQVEIVKTVSLDINEETCLLGL